MSIYQHHYLQTPIQESQGRIECWFGVTVCCVDFTLIQDQATCNAPCVLSSEVTLTEPRDLLSLLHCLLTVTSAVMILPFRPFILAAAAELALLVFIPAQKHNFLAGFSAPTYHFIFFIYFLFIHISFLFFNVYIPVAALKQFHRQPASLFASLTTNR